MSAPEALTYTSLVSDVQIYAERTTDAVFLAQIPRLIMLAENRIASEVRGLGLLQFAMGNFSASNPILAKPARWRETKSFSFIDATGARKYLKLRDYAYCRSFWPTQSVTDVPRYYADYDYEHFLLVATPNSGYAYELAYYERPAPLSPTQQTSWTTQYAPQLLTYATLLEAQPFLKNSERIAEFQALYDRAVSAVSREDSARAVPSTNPGNGAK
jgi:hypothetical protein